MVYGEDPGIDISATGAATIDAPDVLETRRGISYDAAFDHVGQALLDEPTVSKTALAGLPWIVGLLLLTMVIRKKGR